jgi:putative hydrolase of the HAD superfamily
MINNTAALHQDPDKYKHLFFDLDHTIWDFETNARLSMLELYDTLNLRAKGIDDFELFYKNYSKYNEMLWARYRNGYIKQSELRFKRMWLALLDFKIADEKLADIMSVQFLELLPVQNQLFPHTLESLDYLKEKNYHLHLITNGFEKIQHEKLRHSGLTGYFTEVITSEASNSLKPHKEIFEYAFLKTTASLKESIMIGDNIEADIKGAMNAGIDQVFVNHINEVSDVQPTYTVFSLNELKDIF